VRSRLYDLPQNSEAFERARMLLWAGQCNCAYWHGVFGGLYLNFLRAGIWENLLKCEQQIEEALEPGPFIRVAVEDRDYSGEEQIVLTSDRFSLLFSPQLGGSLWELSWRPAAANLLDTLTRRPEAYHKDYLEQSVSTPSLEGGADSIHNRKTMKEEGLLDHLRYDPYPRGALMEHFMEKTATLEEFHKGEYRELGSFLMEPAAVEQERLSAKENSGREGMRLSFRQDGRVGEVELLLEKVVTVYAGEDRIQVDYTLAHRGGPESELCFAVELNLACLGGYDQGRSYHIPGRDLREKNLASIASDPQVEEIRIRDRWRGLKLSLAFSEPALLWRMPIETVSLSEGGLERSYQQSLLLPRWDFTLKPDQQKEIRLTLELGPVKSEEREEAAVGSEVGV
jgi:4-alpha-glucanotransferase